MSKVLDIKELLSYTKGFLNHVYWVKQDLNLIPEKEHIATAINFSDIKERRDDFLKELTLTISSWVYSKVEIKRIIDERTKYTGGDTANASAFLVEKSHSKFRPGQPQGQFGELLLFNFIQYFFEAAPLLRKQRITTSIGHERFGADAIHYKKNNNQNVLILGESKCYESKYRFKQAFSISLESIINTFNKIDTELDLYIYEDFIDKYLEEIAIKYKNGVLENTRFEFVCLIAYNETDKINGENEEDIKNEIISIIKARCGSIDQSTYNSVEKKLLDRINYIIFPIWKLDELLDAFQSKVGST